VPEIAYSLTQLQAFLAVAEQGSFSAAAKYLDKGQPTISHSISTLETHLGVKLFDRSERTPRLTAEGKALIVQAKELIYQALSMEQLAQSLSQTSRGHDLSLVLDVICPLSPAVNLLQNLYSQFSPLSLTVHAEAKGAVTARVLDGTCQLGVTGVVVPETTETLKVEPVGQVEFVAVAAAGHPILEKGLNVSLQSLQSHTQLLVADTSALTADHRSGVVGSEIWRAGNMSILRRFLLEGFGWGRMPRHEIEDELRNGELIAFKPYNWVDTIFPVPLYAIYPKERPLSPVAEAALSQLRELYRS